jgi:hypothetical protein
VPSDTPSPSRAPVRPHEDARTRRPRAAAGDWAQRQFLLSRINGRPRRAPQRKVRMWTSRYTPHAHRTGHHWIDMTVAVAAVFISVVSRAVAILHGRTMERMAEENARLVATNSWPFRQYGPGTVTTDREFLEACCGFDPAKGTPFDSDLVPE